MGLRDKFPVEVRTYVRAVWLYCVTHRQSKEIEGCAGEGQNVEDEWQNVRIEMRGRMRSGGRGKGGREERGDSKSLLTA